MLENNPITDGSLTHFLNFKVPNYGEVEITEPIGFDAFSFNVTQGKDRFGRDKEIGGGAEADLTFSDIYGKECTPYITVDGSLVEVLTHRLDLIFKAIEEKGAETQIEYILKKDGIAFTTGLVDVSESETDTYREFKCTIVQNTIKALIERKKDVVVDVFSEKDTFNQLVVPLSKERILLKAKPTFEFSQWGEKSIESAIILDGVSFTSDVTIPLSNSLKNYGLKDSYAPFDVSTKQLDRTITETRNFVYANRFFKAQEQLTNVKIKINKLRLSGTINSGGNFSLLVVQAIFDDNGNWQSGNTTRLFQIQGSVSLFEEDYELEIPVISSGVSLSIYISAFSSTTSTTSKSTVINSYSVASVEITATSTAVDSVIFGVSEYDFWKQGVKSLSGLYIDAELLKNNKYVFNGNLIRQRDDASLNFKFSDEANDLMLFKHDYQINDENIEIKTYPDFYQNVDMGFYETLPKEGFSRKYNDRFKRITTTVEFKTFQQDKDASNTIDAVHTHAQFLFPITQEEGDEKASMNAIYDPFEIEFSRKEAINSTTALNTDDKIFKIDTIEIPEGTLGSYKGALQMQSNGGFILKILSNGFDWTLLGFNNGNVVSIINGENIGNYTVVHHSATVLDLLGFTENLTPFTGTGYVEIVYPLTNVSLMNRTSEGFDLIEGIAEPNNFSNLIYTIKRILTNESWSSYLSTIGKYNEGEIIKNTDFKVNGELTTQLDGGSLLKENADIIVPTNRILNKYVYETSIAVDFQNAKKLIEDAKTIKGFIRILDPLGKVIRLFVQDMKMTWATGIMEITGEGKNEVDFISIQVVSGGIKIFYVGYNEVINTTLEWFKSDNGYFQFFDNDNNPLINPTYFDKIQVNGVTYLTDWELYDKLIEL